MRIPIGRPLALLALVAASAGAQTAPPDHIYINAMVWTGDAAQPTAQAFALRGDRLVAIGSTASVRALAGANTRTTDLGGRRVVPGFNDAHWHLSTRRRADLVDAGSVAALQQRLLEYAKTTDTANWITGSGWTPSDFPDNTAHKRYLDAVFPDRPVLISDRDGHQSLANSRALALSNVTRDTPDPANGVLVRDTNGEPTGLLKESASSLVRARVAAATPEEVYRAVLSEMDKAASHGLTSLQIAGSGGLAGTSLTAVQRAIAEGALKVRLRAASSFTRGVTPQRLTEYTTLRDEHRGKLLTFGIVKGFVDGTVDAKTAAMLEPLVGGGNGKPSWTQAELDSTVAAYDRAGLQIELHAIGDLAIRMALNAYEHAARVNGTSGRRHRVEHIEVPSLQDIPRFKSLGVIASTQAIFASPDANTLQNYEPLLGPERAARANAFKLFDDAGAVQAFGSDYPVFPMNVLRGMYAAVARQMPDGTPKGGSHPQNRISVEAALAHFTRDAAYASFDERDKGTLTAGKYADFVVLSEDILRGPPERLLTARVLLTVIGGRESYRAPNW